MNRRQKTFRTEEEVKLWPKALIAVALLLLVGNSLFSRWVITKPVSNKVVSQAAHPIREKIRSSASVSAKESSAEIKTTPKTNLTNNQLMHPNVQYESPEKIRSFSDPALLEAYDVYFSLIGEFKQTYLFSRSGFDSDQNLELAWTTLITAPIVSTDDSTLMSRALAFQHLLVSELPRAEDLRMALRDLILNQLQSSSNPTQRSILSLDLQKLLSKEALQNPRSVAGLYHSTNDETVRGTIELVLYRQFEKETKNEQELKERLAELEVQEFALSQKPTILLPPNHTMEKGKEHTGSL